MRSLKTTFSEGAWFTAVRLIGTALSSIISVLLARVLAPTDYGLFAMATAFTGAAALINECGLGPALVQQKHISKTQIDSCFWLSLTWSAAIYVAVFASAPLIALFFGEERLIPIVRVIGLNLVITSLGVIPDSMLMRTMKFRNRSLAEFLGILTQGSVAYLLALQAFGVWSLVLGWLVGSVTCVISLFLLFPWRPTGGLRLGQIKDMLAFGANLTGSRILWYSYSNADNIIVAKFLDSNALGLYSMAYDLATRPLQKVTTLINQLAFPIFSKQQDQIHATRRYFLEATRYIGMLAMPAMSGAILVAPELVDTLLAQKWSAMTIPFRLLCGVSLLQALAAIIPPLLNSRGKAYLTLRYSIVCFAVMPASLLIGVHFGLNAVALAWLLVYPFLFLYLLTIGLQEIGVSIVEYLRVLSPTLAITLAMAVAVGAFRQAAWGYLNSSSVLLGAILIGVVTYTSLLMLASNEVRSHSARILGALRPQGVGGR